MLGLQTGEGGVIQYFLGEEDSRYHGVGQIDGENFGVDPGKAQIYRNIGAQEILTSGKADVVFIWDPDGDRFNMVTTAPAAASVQAAEMGLGVETFPSSDKCIVYFTPNQIFFMLAAYRIEALKADGLLTKYDWFVTRSVATTRSVAELAAGAGLPSADVRVGFKYMGTFAEWAENRKDASEPFISPTGARIVLGDNPRPLIMCEESGGAIFGGTNLLWNRNSTRGMLALREKDAMQIAALALSLAAHLYDSGRSFADYYCDNIRQADIKNRYFSRCDLSLYDESLSGPERESAKEEGMARRDRAMDFFTNLGRQFTSGAQPETLRKQLNANLASNAAEQPLPKKICDVGDGTLLEFEPFWCVVRASGTDAVLRYYIEGPNRQEVEEALNSFATMQI